METSPLSGSRVLYLRVDELESACRLVESLRKSLDGFAELFHADVQSFDDLGHLVAGKIQEATPKDTEKVRECERVRMRDQQNHRIKKKKKKDTQLNEKRTPTAKQTDR
jgi:hypothetical protein